MHSRHVVLIVAFAFGQDGHEDGLGVFTFKDGSTYDGFWKRGKKHGIGVLRPAPAIEPRQNRSSGGTGPPPPPSHNISPDAPAAAAAAAGADAAIASAGGKANQPAGVAAAPPSGASSGDVGTSVSSERSTSDPGSGVGNGVGLAAHGSAAVAPKVPQMGASVLDLAAMAEGAGQQQQLQQQQQQLQAQPLDKIKERIVVIKVNQGKPISVAACLLRWRSTLRLMSRADR